jgi:hypothetical protein
MEKERISYNTTLDAVLLKRLKHLSIELNKRQNEILDEAIADILKKYGKEIPQHEEKKKE